MPFLEIPGGKLHYDVQGDGYPVLLFAPGFLSSRIERWRTNPARPGVPQDWLDPIAALSRRFRLIALDVRNAGESRAELRAGDDWTTYTARHPGICSIISASRDATSWAHASACRSPTRMAAARPDLVSAMVLQNPIGLSSVNRQALDQEFDKWAAEVRGWPGVEGRNMPGFRQRMFGGDFIFSVSREFVARCTIPALLMPGDDLVHPAEVSADIARAPQVEVLAPWKGVALRDGAMRRVGEFLIATHGGNAVTKIAVLDDWQRVARSMRRLVAADGARRSDVLRRAVRGRGRRGAPARAVRHPARDARAYAVSASRSWSRLPNLKMFGLTGASRRLDRHRRHDRCAASRSATPVAGRRRQFDRRDRARSHACRSRGAIPAADAAVRAGRFQLGTRSGSGARRQDARARRARPHRRADGGVRQRTRDEGPRVEPEPHRRARGGGRRHAASQRTRCSRQPTSSACISCCPPRTRGVLGAGRSRA